MRRPNLDLDVLRSFVTGVEVGSFAKAAERLGRSASALSTQLKKVEEHAGAAVLQKSGRRLVLTPVGEVMLAYARRMLELNDEAVDAVREMEVEGEVRIGVQEDFGEGLLIRVLGAFGRAHPRVTVQVRIARNAELVEEVGRGRLDLALAWGGEELPAAPSRRIARLPTEWIGPRDPAAPPLDPHGPIALALLEAPCLMRTQAIAALDRARRPWRVAFTSASLAGVWAAVSAGLGITVRTRAALPQHLRALAGLPQLPLVSLNLYRSDSSAPPAVARLEGLMVRHVKQLLRA